MHKITLPALICAIVLLYVIPAISEDAKTKEEVLKATWVAAEPVFKVNAGFEKFAPTVTFTKDCRVGIANRGYLVSKQKYKKGVTFRAKWSWTSDEPLQYPDHLAIVMRGNGKSEGVKPFEAEGLRVKFNPSAKAVMVEEQKDGKATSLGKSEGQIILGEKQVYDVEVEDTGDSLIVRINGNEVLKQKVNPPDGNEEFHVVLYNREPVAGFVKVSELENPTITEKK